MSLAPAHLFVKESGLERKLGKVPRENPGVNWGWELTTQNTGLAGAGINPNSLPTYSGSISAGQTIVGQKIVNSVDLSTLSNVTFEKCLFKTVGGGSNPLILGPGSTLVDCDIDHTGMTDPGTVTGAYASANGFTIRRCLFWGMSVGIWADVAGLITDTYVHGLITPTSDRHADAFTRRGGTGLLEIRKSRMDASATATTAAFFLQDTNGVVIDNVNVYDTYFEGLGYTVLLENKAGNHITTGMNNIRIRSTGYAPFSNGGFGPVTVSPSDMWTYNPSDPINQTDGGRKGTAV